MKNAKITFAEQDVKLSDCKLVLASSSVAYNGANTTPKIKSFTDGKEKLKENSDYRIKSYKNCNKIGTATITIEGKGRFCGTITKSFKIVPLDVKNIKLSSIPKQRYTGKAIKPKLSVVVNKTTMKQGTDYALAYKNNTKIGTATITMTGKGKLSGKRTLKFAIVKQKKTVAVKSVKLNKISVAITTLMVNRVNNPGLFEPPVR